MLGGKLLGTGSSSCVFSPNIPCKKNGRIDNNRVSKLLYHHDAKNLSKYEKKQGELIKNIKGYKDWAVIYDEFCDAPNPEMVKNYDNEGYIDCFGDNNNLYNFDVTDEPYDEAQLLNSDNGGNTLKNLFNELFNGNLTPEILSKKFKTLMGMFIPLFKGLKEMDKNKIVHNDIKSINITGDFNGLKYIDFGLAAKITNKRHFIIRSKSEGNTKRIYHHYPLDYIFLYMDDDKLQNELQLLNIMYRRNYNILYSIYDIFDFNIVDQCNDLYISIINNEYKIDDVIRKIDVYSLGIQVPLLFLELGFTSQPVGSGNIIKDFYELFKLMINPNLKERLTSDEAYNKFMELIKKHNIDSKKTTKKAEPKKTTPKKAAPKKTAPKKTSKRVVTPRRVIPRRTTPRRTTSRRTTPHRKTHRRTTPRRTTYRRTTPRRTTPRRTTPRRTTIRRTTIRRTTPRRTTPRRTTPRKRVNSRRRTNRKNN